MKRVTPTNFLTKKYNPTTTTPLQNSRDLLIETYLKPPVTACVQPHPSLDKTKKKPLFRGRGRGRLQNGGSQAFAYLLPPDLLCNLKADHRSWNFQLHRYIGLHAQSCSLCQFANFCQTRKQESQKNSVHRLFAAHFSSK